MWANLRNLFNHRALIQALVSRELKARYRGSVLGFLWSFVNPLLLLLIYSFVFTVIFQPIRSEGMTPYALFLFCGLLPWSWFSSSLLESSAVLSGNANLIQKVIFPADVLPFVSVFSNFVHFLLGLPILFAFLIYFRRPLNIYLLFFLGVVLIQLIFTLGFALFISSLSVHFRDIRDLLANLLTFWFFSTPIIYPATMIPESFRWVLKLNPMTHIMMGYQDTLFRGVLPHWKRLSVTLLVSMEDFYVGYFIFDRLRDSFAEEV